MVREDVKKYFLTKGLILSVKKGPGIKTATLSQQGTDIKTVNLLSDKVARKIFVTEAVALGASVSSLADALNISRQTIYNYVESKRYFGMEGLIHGYKSSDSKDLHKQRKIHEKKRPSGNKAIQIAELKQQEKKREAEEAPEQLAFNFSISKEDAEAVAVEDQPFSENHDWESSRYAGSFLYWPALISKWGWLQSIIQHYGAEWKIFAVFMLMSSLNIRSIEQLKNTRFREFGIILGLKRLPGKSKVWEWFYRAANINRAKILLKDYFQQQIQSGMVGLWMWFIDGHLLPYTGKASIHYSYNTQRQRAVPGRTNQVVCDANGRIVDFTIEEGKGHMKDVILTAVEKWLPDLPSRPVVVFDREGYDASFFSRLVNAKQPFVTWDKNVNTSKLSMLDNAVFCTEFTFNNKDYAAFEKEKSFSYKGPAKENEVHKFTLRHIHIWNKTSNRRTCILAFSEPCDGMSLRECAEAILSRWGASENTFKHIKDRHPLHYNPGFKLVESEKQDIANPEIKGQESIIQGIKKSLSKLYKSLSNVNQLIRKDGQSRANSAYDRIKSDIQKQKEDLEQHQKAKSVLPERVDVSSLEDYDSFKSIDNEGKNLFDFVTASVWNARKEMSDWLGEYYDQENEIIDLFYAITYCQGWVKTTNDEVVVRLEYLQQSKRRLAQEHLCRKLTSLGAQMPNGKRLIIEVGESPLR